MLDVAAGTGLAAREALGAVDHDDRVVAADIARQMLRAGRDAVRDRRCGWVAADAAAAPFRAASFDALLCVAAVPYFPDPSLSRNASA